MKTSSSLRRFRTAFAVVATTLALLVVPVSAAHAGPGEGEFVDRLNGVRAAAGLPPLAVAGDLTSVAQSHSARMAATGSLHHNPNLATQVTNWSALGENVGYGGSVLSVHNALYASAPHRANMLSTTFTQVGVGTAVSADGRLWVTQVFRKPTVAAATGFPLVGVIGATYPSVAGVLGVPTSAEYDVLGGRGQRFQHGEILWSLGTGAREVHGAILGRYRTLGGPWSAIGLPTTHEMATPDGRGRYNHFQRGSVYWTARTGAFEVRGAIRDTWARLGWERGPLGYPVTDELRAPDGIGRFNAFEGGSVYWTPRTGAHEVRGAIRDTWARLGWERGPLGYPVTDELPAPDRIGRFTVFQGGSVYWTPRTGAHEVRGAIRDAWARLGWEHGLGYPVSDEYSVPGGRRSDFERGSLVWDTRTGRTTVV